MAQFKLWTKQFCKAISYEQNFKTPVYLEYTVFYI